MLKRAMREMGSRGGKRRLKTLTAEERIEIARKAGKKSGEVRSKKAAAKKKQNKPAPKKRGNLINRLLSKP